MKLPLNFWEIHPALRSLYNGCMEPICDKYGITMTEFDILLFLGNNPKFDTAADISEIRCIVKSRVSISLQSLEAGGYIRKETEQEDKRRIKLTLTDKAGKVVREGRKKQLEFVGMLTEGLSPEDVRQLSSYTKRWSRTSKTGLTGRGNEKRADRRQKSSIGFSFQRCEFTSLITVSTCCVPGNISAGQAFCGI